MRKSRVKLEKDFLFLPYNYDDIMFFIFKVLEIIFIMSEPLIVAARIRPKFIS